MQRSGRSSSLLFFFEMVMMGRDARGLKRGLEHLFLCGARARGAGAGLRSPVALVFAAGGF